MKSRFEHQQESNSLNKLPPLPLNIFSQEEAVPTPAPEESPQVNRRQRKLKVFSTQPFGQMVSRNKAQQLDSQGKTFTNEVVVQPKYNSTLPRSLLTELDETVQQRKKELNDKN